MLWCPIGRSLRTHTMCIILYVDDFRLCVMFWINTNIRKQLVFLRKNKVFHNIDFALKFAATHSVRCELHIYGATT